MHFLFFYYYFFNFYNLFLKSNLRITRDSNRWTSRNCLHEWYFLQHQTLLIVERRDRKGKEKVSELICVPLRKNVMAAKDEEEAKKKEKSREGLEEVLKGREEQMQALKARKAEEAPLMKKEEVRTPEY